MQAAAAVEQVRAIQLELEALVLVETGVLEVERQPLEL